MKQASPLSLRQLLGKNSSDFVASIQKDNPIIRSLQSDIGTVCSIITDHRKRMKASGEGREAQY